MQCLKKKEEPIAKTWRVKDSVAYAKGQVNFRMADALAMAGEWEEGRLDRSAGSGEPWESF